MIKNIKNVTPEENKVLRQVFWRTMGLSSSYTFERMQALAYVYAMIPVIDLYYTKKEDKIAAYSRHFELFNTTPTMGGFVTGLSASMEKQAASDPDFDVASINAVKVSLMGPFAGIGDSIFWGSLRIISLGIGASLCADGNPIGILVHLLLFNIPAFAVRYYGVYIGFSLGSQFMRTATESGVLAEITKAATLVGLMTVGAMSALMIRFETTLVLRPTEGVEVVIQDLLDAIYPNLLPLLLLFGCYSALKKGVKPHILMIAMLVLGIVGRIIGIV